jgi:hypothetical protein
VALPNPLFVWFVDSSHILCVRLREWAQERLCELTRAFHFGFTSTSFEVFVTLGGLPPRRLGVAGWLPRLWWVAGSLWGLWSCLFVKKITLVGRRKVVETDPTYCGNGPLQAPQRRRSRSLVGGELRETNPWFFMWFASLSCFSSFFYLLPLWSTWVCYSCVQGSLPCLWSSRKATYQVWFVIEVKRSLKLFLQVLCATPVWPVPPVRPSKRPVWPVTTTDLTGGHWQLKFSGTKS